MSRSKFIFTLKEDTTEKDVAVLYMMPEYSGAQRRATYSEDYQTICVLVGHKDEYESDNCKQSRKKHHHAVNLHAMG